MTRFSVIVPVYNIEEYISQCITSILEQSFRDFELIIIDDGSTDRSGDICDGFAAYDDRIKVLHKENGGPSEARNEGINIARGEYIIFVDGDDFIEPESFNKISEGIFLANEPEVLVTRIKRVFGDESQVFMDEGIPVETLMNGKKEDYLRWIFISSDNSWPTVRYVVQRSFVSNNNLLFPRGHLHEDVDWVSRLFLKAESFGCLDYYWYNHRKGRKGSTTATRNPKRTLDMINIAASNIKDTAYRELPEDLRIILFERLVKSVFYELRDFNHFVEADKEKILRSLKQNKDILKYTSKKRHKLFLFFSNTFGFKASFFLMSLIFGES